MRCFCSVAALFLTISLAAQAPKEKWTFGLHTGTPELTGHYKDDGDTRVDFNIKDDFNLKTDTAGLGIHMEYLGSRFGFSLNYGIHDYAGKNRLTREIEIAGKPFKAGMDIDSSLKQTTFELNWTAKILRSDNAWLGVDVGLQAWYLDVQANGILLPEYQPVETVEVNETYTAPIPHLGVSCGLYALNNRLVINGKAHFLALKGAKYTRYGADVRYYFLPWLGARVFADFQKLDAPDGSIEDKVDANFDRKGFGFGVVARW